MSPIVPFSKLIRQCSDYMKVPPYSHIDGWFKPVDKRKGRNQIKKKIAFDTFGYIVRGEQCSPVDQDVLYALIMQATSHVRMCKGDIDSVRTPDDIPQLQPSVHDSRLSICYHTTVYKIAQDVFPQKNGKLGRPEFDFIYDSLDRLASMTVSIYRYDENGKRIRATTNLLSYMAKEENGKSKMIISFSEFFSMTITETENQFTMINYKERIFLSNPLSRLVYSYLCYAVRPGGALKGWSIQALMRHIYGDDDASPSQMSKRKKALFEALSDVSGTSTWKIVSDEKNATFSARRRKIKAG